MSRRLARETALQVLFQIDMTDETGDLANVIDHWAQEFAVSDKSVEFTRQLVIGTLDKKNEIDQKLAEKAHEWSIDRMSAVDRNLMRLAVYEMLYCPDTPQKVILNEAIEIAKRFGGEDSAKFINGILDQFMTEKEKSAKK